MESLLQLNEDYTQVISQIGKDILSDPQENHHDRPLIKVKQEEVLQLKTNTAEEMTNPQHDSIFTFEGSPDFIEEPQKPNDPANNFSVSLTRLKQKQQLQSSLGETKEDQNDFICPKCTRKFICKSRMNSHMKWDCNQPRKYKCPYCKYRSSRCGDIYKHIPRVHTGRKVYCLILNVDKMKSVEGTEVWVTFIQKKKEKPICVVGPYKCDTCSKEFRERQKLVNHLKSCNKERRYRCPYCLCRSATNNYVFRHVRLRHPKEKIYCFDQNGDVINKR